jgi:hypothetical protein
MKRSTIGKLITGLSIALALNAVNVLPARAAACDYSRGIYPVADLNISTLVGMVQRPQDYTYLPQCNPTQGVTLPTGWNLDQIYDEYVDRPNERLNVMPRTVGTPTPAATPKPANSPAPRVMATATTQPSSQATPSPQPTTSPKATKSPVTTAASNGKIPQPPMNTALSYIALGILFIFIVLPILAAAAIWVFRASRHQERY